MRVLGIAAAFGFGCASAGPAAPEFAREAVAPLSRCEARFSASLGNVDAWVAAGGEAPDTAIAFSPDGDRVAVGTVDGQILIFDAWTGVRRAATTVPEAVIREVAWTEDGRSLWAGEQGPVARVRRWDARTLELLAEFSFSTDLGEGTPGRGDPYARYALPGVFGLVPAGDGVVAAGVRGWSEQGVRYNRSRIVRLNADGRVVAAWPPSGPADATLFYPVIGGDRLVVSVGRSADGSAPSDLPIDGWQRLRVDDLVPMGTARLEPLEPYFDRVFTWRALGVDDRGVFVGVGDGRVAALGADSAGPEWVQPLGTPQRIAGVPLAASIGFGTSVAGDFAVITADTSIPYGTSDPFARPPRAHPDANTLWYLGRGGEIRFRWSGPPRLDGMARSPSGEWLVVGAGARTTDDRRDLFGALVFSTGADPRFLGFCPTAAPVFSRFDVADDGRVAMATYPWRSGNAIVGAYELVVLR
jgi:WD40 repeat protein